MDERINSGDTIKIDNDMWHHAGENLTNGEKYFVHAVKYKEPSTAVELTLEGKSDIFHITLASNQIYKVT